MECKKDVKVFLFNYNEIKIQNAFLENLLTREEKEKSSQFTTLELQFRFKLRRALLKSLIGKFQNIDPLNVEISHDSNGKPLCRGIFFSYSDSNELLIYAFSEHSCLGIDIEFIDAKFDFQPLIAEVLSREEHAQFDLLQLDERKEIFFRLWTAKEAALKYLGTGLLQPLASIEFEIMKDQKMQLKSLGRDKGAFVPFYQDIAIDKSYVCSVVTDRAIEPGELNIYQIRERD